MEGERFSSFACSLLTKRPRLSTQNSQETRDPSNGEHSNNSNLLRKYEPTDEQLLSWQERQIAKCIVDNTVNRVVESYLTFFEDENEDMAMGDDPEQHHLLNPAGDNPFEESAILWAIEEHGLQQNFEGILNGSSDDSSSSSSSSSSSLSSSSSSTSDSSSASSSSLSDSKFFSPRVNPIPSSDDGHSDSNASKETPDSDNNSKSEQCSASTSETNSTNQNSSAMENNHFDFMETAVSVAIQKKGLSSQTHGVQMSPSR